MKKVLIVDDLQQNLYMLEVLLKTNGFEVEKAGSGNEALELASKNKPDVIVSDILMPGMDGFALCRTWKADEELTSIPFIFYTATYTDPRDEKLAYSLGAERFLVKPMEVNEFLANLHEVLEEKSTHSLPQSPQSGEAAPEFYKEYNEALIRKLEDKMLELQKSNQRLSALFQASSILHSPKSPNETISIILKTIVEIIHYENALYFSIAEDSKDLILEAYTGFSESAIQTLKEHKVIHKEEKSLLTKVANYRKPLLVNDVSQEPNCIRFDASIQSAMIIPVLLEKKLYGVIGLYSPKLNAFTQDDEESISALSNNLAIAIDNYRNQERVTKQLEKISALHYIDMAISNSMDLSTTLNILLEQVTTQQHIDAADVLLINKDTGECQFSAGRGFLFNTIADDAIRGDQSFDKRSVKSKTTIQISGLTGEKLTPKYIEMWEKEKFKMYMAVPLLSKGQVVGVLEVYNRSDLSPDSEWVDFLNTLAGQAAIAIENSIMLEELSQSHTNLIFAYDATIKGWSKAMDLRDKETEGHTQRVTEMTMRLAKAMGVNNEKMRHIQRGALLHDMGKLGVPDGILLKPGPLTDEEWVIMKQHPQIAYDMLSPIEYLRPALEIPYCHHEKWDGSGYPRGLSGEDIPLAARLFAIVDVWDALSSDRPYRPAWSSERVMEYLQSQSGKHFDPRIFDEFNKVLRDYTRR